MESLFARNHGVINAHTFMAGQTWLGFAAQDGKLLSIKKLFELGADPNIGDCTYGMKPLCSACFNAHAEVARFLVDNGSEIDTDASVKNPLFAAIVGRSVKCVKIILDAGIDTGIRYNSKTMTDMDAVAFALMHGARSCAEVIALWNAGDDEHAATQAMIVADEIAHRNAYGVG